MIDPNRLPTPQDYRDAVQIYDEVMQGTGDAWVQAMRREARTRDDVATFDREHLVVGLARYVEPVESDNPSNGTFIVVDKTVSKTRAYKHGIFAGYAIAESVHGGRVPLENIVATLQGNLVEHFGESGNQYAWADYLIQVSEEGLKHLPPDSREVVDRWSESYSANVDLQRMHTLGVGGTLAAGIFLHERYVDRVVERVLDSEAWNEVYRLDSSGENETNLL